jgi:uncharacterized protein (DUF305 family)
MKLSPLLYGLIGFLVGGLLVSVAATTFDKPAEVADKAVHSDLAASLQGLQGDDFDKAFLVGMIEHHEDAVDMAKQAEGQAKHEEVKELSNEIIEAQQKEIDMMRQWQQDWGYAGSTHPDGAH